jgi:hypothetical protein
MKTLFCRFQSLNCSMGKITWGIMLLLILATPLFAADATLSPVGKVLDQEIKMIEGEFVSLAEAMPAEKYSFAPTMGEFKGVRTFGQQVAHTASAVYTGSAAILEEKPPVDLGADGNGPATLKTKDDIVKYLKGAFTYAHKAMAKLTAANLTDEVPAAWGGKSARLFMADLILWHSFDHYGQMVVYARMNGIVPPASRPKK